MQPNTNFYNPSTPEGNDDGMVLKPIVFKPFKNTKTNNFFSYAYDVIERNQSANADSDIEWVHGAPEKIQRKIDAVKKLHDKIKEKRAYLKKKAKRLSLDRKDEIQEEIAEIFMEIDEVIYPESERVYVESKESIRFRKEQQNELTLDAASIAALTGNPQQQIVGSTADASIAQAKLELAEQRLAEIEEQDNTELEEMKAKLEEAQAELKKPPSRRKAGFKPDPVTTEQE